MLIKRRSFLQSASLATAALWLPRFLQAQSAPRIFEHQGKILVVLQLSGGNDGLNTVLPIQNDIYYRERPRLAIPKKEALLLTDEVGLHPSLGALRSMYESGDLAILNSVGYPNPDRSHFRSMDIWQSASPADQYWQTGWLGRYMDAQCKGNCPRPSAVLEIDDTLSLAAKGVQMSGVALQDPKQLFETANSPYFKAYSASHVAAHDDHQLVDYLYKTMRDALSSADYIYEKSRVKPAKATYPNSEIGKHLKTIASLICSDSDTSVYYASHGSFDTHVNQAAQQKRLFDDLNAALVAFVDDLKKENRWKDVLIVTFSEFGRRVAQNASGGTDHGMANQMFFMGGGLKEKGMLNALPSLTDLDQGDMRYQVDFRQVYATILEKWLGTASEPILGSRFDVLKFI